jgi:hypothetical protein
VRFAPAGPKPITEEEYIALAISGGMDPAEAVQKWETIKSSRTQVKDTGVYNLAENIFYPAGYETVDTQIHGYPGTYKISKTDAFRLDGFLRANDEPGYMAYARSIVAPFGKSPNAAPIGGTAPAAAVAAPVTAARAAPPAAVAPGAAPSAAVPAAVPAAATGQAAASAGPPKQPVVPAAAAAGMPAAQAGAAKPPETGPDLSRANPSEGVDLSKFNPSNPEEVQYLRTLFEGIKDRAQRERYLQALDARVAAQSGAARPAAAAQSAAAQPAAAAATGTPPVAQTAAAQPAAAGPAAATRRLSQEELAAKVERDKKIQEAETQIEIEKRKTFAQKADEAPDTITTATMLRDFAGDKDAKKITGILSNDKVSSQIATLLKEGIGTRDIRVAIPGLETAMRNSGLGPEGQAKFRVFLQTVELMRLQMSKYAKGSVTDFEQRLFGAATVSTEDTVEAVRMKADLLTRRAQFDREAYKQWKNSKLTADEFKESDKYFDMRVAYDKDLSAISLGKMQFQSGAAKPAAAAARPGGAAAAAGQPSSDFIRDQKTGVIRRKKAGE